MRSRIKQGDYSPCLSLEPSVCLCQIRLRHYCLALSEEPYVCLLAHTAQIDHYPNQFDNLICRFLKYSDLSLSKGE